MINMESNKEWKKLYVVSENLDGHVINDYISGTLNFKTKREYSNKGETIFVPWDYYQKILQKTELILLRREPTGIVKWVDASNQEAERDYNTMSVGALRLADGKSSINISDITKILGDKNIKIYQIPQRSYYLVDYKLDIDSPDNDFTWKQLRTEGFAGINDRIKTNIEDLITEKAQELTPYIDRYFSTDYDGYINPDKVIVPKLIKK